MKAQYVQYRHRNGQVKIDVALDYVDIRVGDIDRTRPIGHPNSGNPYTGALSFVAKRDGLRVTVVEATFIEKVGVKDGRSYRPIRVYDDDIRVGEKSRSKLAFLDAFGRLPVVWTNECPRYVYMDYSGIPEEIKEGDLLVKLKVVWPGGEDEFERRFPLQQVSYVDEFHPTD